MNAISSEFLQLKGDLLLAQSRENMVEVESFYQKAVDVAGEMQALMMELRAALRLSRLWREQGKTEEARRVLSEAYGKFSEGFGILDLIEAKALLDELGGGLAEQDGE
jgi:adenylate cyclase